MEQIPGLGGFEEVEWWEECVSLGRNVTRFSAAGPGSLAVPGTLPPIQGTYFTPILPLRQKDVSFLLNFAGVLRLTQADFASDLPVDKSVTNVGAGVSPLQRSSVFPGILRSRPVDKPGHNILHTPPQTSRVVA